MVNEDDPGEDVIWVLLDAPEEGDLSRYAGPLQISVEKLQEHLRTFTSAIAKALAGCQSLGREFELTEVLIKAKLSAEAGFALVSKAGVEGAVELKFTRKRS